MRFSLSVTQFYLAVANYGNDTSKLTNSTIFKWHRHRKKFREFQTIGTYTARDMEFFSIEDEHYLAVANHAIGRWNYLTLKTNIAKHAMGKWSTLRLTMNIAKDSLDKWRYLRLEINIAKDDIGKWSSLSLKMNIATYAIGKWSSL